MRIYPLNERAITIELGDTISEEVHRRVMALRDEIFPLSLAGIVDVVTAYTTVTVYFDPYQIQKTILQGATPYRKVERWLSGLANNIKEQTSNEEKNVVIIPVCYDKEFAPDLEWVANFHQTTTDEIVRRHTHHHYTVFMIGFTPGFPYMGILPPDLESPRKQNPRIQVAAGSVGLAGKQTGIYPFTTPGGWQIIGRTPSKLFDATLSHPSLLKPGDKVKFESIAKDQFEKLNPA